MPLSLPSSNAPPTRVKWLQQVYKEAGELGFEPRQEDQESAVLPLHHSPVISMTRLLTLWILASCRSHGKADQHSNICIMLFQAILRNTTTAPRSLDERGAVNSVDKNITVVVCWCLAAAPCN